jgi:hypothetical protein
MAFSGNFLPTEVTLKHASGRFPLDGRRVSDPVGSGLGRNYGAVYLLELDSADRQEEAAPA